MNLQELKNKKPEELLKQADKLEIENPLLLESKIYYLLFKKK